MREQGAGSASSRRVSKRMLRITGRPVKKQQYTRIPMTDGAGKVSAFVHDSRINYRPLGGTNDERYARAQIIASEVDGELFSHPKENDYIVYAVTCRIG